MATTLTRKVLVALFLALLHPRLLTSNADSILVMVPLVSTCLDTRMTLRLSMKTQDE